MGLEDKVELLGNSLLTLLNQKFKYYPVKVYDSKNKDAFSFKFKHTDYSIKIINSGDYLSVNLEVEPLDNKGILEDIKNQKLESSVYLKDEQISWLKSSQINFSCRLEKTPDNHEESAVICSEIWRYMIQRSMKPINATEKKLDSE